MNPIADNDATQTYLAVQAWLAKHPSFNMHLRQLSTAWQTGRNTAPAGPCLPRLLIVVMRDVPDEGVHRQSPL